MERTIPADEYLRWKMFAKDEPFGHTRDDLAAGVIASAIFKTMGGVKDAKPYNYMPIVRHLDQMALEESVDLQTSDTVSKFNKMLGGRVKVVKRRD